MDRASFSCRDNLLNQFISSSKVRTLRLLNFDINSDSRLEIYNEYIEELDLCVGKSATVGQMYLPRLKKFNNEHDYFCECIAHAMNGGLKIKLYEGCKNIQFFNDIDLFNLPNADKFSTWYENVSSLHPNSEDLRQAYHTHFPGGFGCRHSKNLSLNIEEIST